jgi:flagellar secretion chaperone FliS
MTTPMPRDRYLTDLVTTASPARLLVLLYDRLALDLNTAGTALGGQDWTTANTRLQHAQAIVVELRASLDLTAWSAAPGLAALYEFLLTELVNANVGRDTTAVARCLALVEPLRDAWRQATLAGTIPGQKSGTS